MSVQNKPVSNFWIYLIASIPILLYIIIIWQNSANTPEGDSYINSVFLLVLMSSADNLTDKFNFFVFQYVDHSLLWNRATAWFISVLRGHLDYQWMVSAGFIVLISIIIVFDRCIKEYDIPRVCTLFPVFFIFNLSYWDVSAWFEALVAYLGTVLLSFLAFYYLDKKKPYVFLALLCTYAASLNMSNGILSIFIGSGIIGVNQFIKNKKYTSHQHIIWWTGCLILLIIHIFFRQTSVQISLQSTGFQNSIREFLATIAAPSFYPSAEFHNLKIGIGSIFCTMAITLMFFKRTYEFLAILGLALFCGASLFAASFFRYPNLSTMAGFSYLTVILYSCLFICLLSCCPRKNIFLYSIIICIAAGLFNIRTYAMHYPKIKQHRLSLDTQLFDWLHLGNSQQVDFFDGIAYEAIKKGLYRPLESHRTLPVLPSGQPIDSCQHHLNDANTQQNRADTRDLNIKNLKINTVDTAYTLSITLDSMINSTKIILLCSKERSYLFSLDTEIVKNAKRLLNGNQVLLDKRHIKPTVYDVYTLDQTGDILAKKTTQKVNLHTRDFKRYCQEFVLPAHQKLPFLTASIKTYFCNPKKNTLISG